MRQLLSLLICVFIAVSDALAQSSDKIEFGNVDKTEFAYGDADISDALVLYSGGEYSMEARLSSVFSISKKVHRRIRILTAEGLRHTKVVIPYVRFSSYTERVGNIKAYVYTLEGDSVVVSKMDKSFVNDFKDGFSYRRKEFEIPYVKEGSIVEYSYEITGVVPQIYETSSSSLFSDIQVLSGADNTILGIGTIFPKWYFQEDVPVLRSELHFKNFDEYKFGEILSGADKITREESVGQVYRVKKKLQFSQWDFSISTGTHSREMGIRKDMSWLFDAFEEKMRNHIIFQAENLPAVDGREKYTINPAKWKSAVEFVFQGKDSDMEGMQNAISGWADVDNTFHNRSTFSRKLFFSQNYYKDTVSAIMSKFLPESEKVKSINRLIKNDIKCISYGGGAHISSLKDVFRHKRGTDMEIAAMAYIAFKDAGFKTDLVMFKSRDKGVLASDEVSVSAMNSAVVRVALSDGSMLYFDPRSNKGDMKMLNSLNLVREARIFGKGETFVDLSRIVVNKENHTAVLGVDSKGMMEGAVTTIATNHSCYDMLGRLDDYGSSDDYLKHLGRSINGELLEGHLFEPDTINHIFKREFKFRRTTSIMLDDKMFINPFVEIFCKEEEFASEKRMYPIEFSCPNVIEYNVNLLVPEGYVVADLPVNQEIVLGKAGAGASIRSRVHGNFVLLGLTIRRDGIYIPLEEYAHYREYWLKVCELFDEVVVLKKKGSKSSFEEARITAI
ncbi:MAG: DUF3857 domain-containing protein [Bacteroidales bacterium]|nr:DUF3857 domain-containing protein [Bacteroidales bacterium]